MLKHACARMLALANDEGQGGFEPPETVALRV